MITADRDRGRVDREASSGHDVFDLTWSDDSASGLVRVDFDVVAHRTTAVVVVIGPADRLPVAVVARDLPVPQRRLEMRGPGIWLELGCETPLDHWTVGLEAFGVTVDEGAVISADTRGERTPLGLDLDLDTVDPGPAAVSGGFSVPLRVHGQVLWGQDVRDVDCRGRRARGDVEVAVGPELANIRERIQPGQA